tara:strand:- start:539 stop:1027 length:489 start_codon:yes stop_codon:yes gene_type:complete
MDESVQNQKELPLRTCVGIVLLNNKNNVFVGKRIDNPINAWQMPQGGVGENENLFEAAKRELEEETGVKSIKLIKQLDKWLEYDLPKHLLGKVWNGKYRGQRQRWFIVKFIGNDNEINVNTKNPEFSEWKWILPSELPGVAVNFKVNIYKKINEEINLLGLS